MVREFKLPDVGEGVAEGELVSWLVEPGDTVSEDQPVAEVETDKALVEVPAPVDGTVRELRAEEGEIVPVGNVLITFDVAGEDTSAETDETGDSAKDSSDSQHEAATEAGFDGQPASESDAPDGDTETVTTPDGRVFAPPSVRRLARAEGVDLESLQKDVSGPRVTEADVRATASGSDGPETSAGPPESDDSSADIQSETRQPAGSSVQADSSAKSERVAENSTGTETGSTERDRTLAAPATRRLAQEQGIDIDAVPTDETRDGEAFVTPEAIEEYATASQSSREAETDSRVRAEMPTGERERREPFDGVRRTIAKKMVESKASAPHVTHHDEVDVTDLVAVRERLNSRAEAEGIGLTYMPFLTKAVVAALEEYPEMNAMIDDDAEEIVYREYYNIGVATATDVGLMVPVVEDVDRKGLLQLASEMNELVEKARERSIAPDELRGSTFTITNVGGIGGEYATPILNYPESGILAIGEIRRKPRVVTDEDGAESIEPRSVMPLSLTFDHQLIDGAIGARFTNTVMEYLEQPELLLLE